MIKINLFDNENFGKGITIKTPCFEMIPKVGDIIYDDMAGSHDVHYLILKVQDVKQQVIGDELGYMILIEMIGEDFITDEGKRIVKYYNE